MKKILIPNIATDYQNNTPLILRDILAIERTKLANERTLFSYIRTSLYLSLGGLGLLKLDNLQHLKWLAYSAFSISLLLLVFGLIRYLVFNKRLQKFYNPDLINQYNNPIESDKKI